MGVGLRTFLRVPSMTAINSLPIAVGGLFILARGMLLRLIEEDRYDEVLEVLSKCTSCQLLWPDL